MLCLAIHTVLARGIPNPSRNTQRSRLFDGVVAEEDALELVLEGRESRTLDLAGYFVFDAWHCAGEEVGGMTCEAVIGGDVPGVLRRTGGCSGGKGERGNKGSRSDRIRDRWYGNGDDALCNRELDWGCK